MRDVASRADGRGLETAETRDPDGKSREDEAGGSSAGRMRITLNGEVRDVARGTTLADVLAELGRDPRTVAVEHNGEILPRRCFANLELSEGDRLEIVHFVQGG